MKKNLNRMDGITHFTREISSQKIHPLAPAITAFTIIMLSIGALIAVYEIILMIK